MLSGVKYPRKKLSTIAQERFSVENMAYIQMFIDYLHTEDPFKLRFFNECSLKLPSHGKRLYSHAPVTEKDIGQNSLPFLFIYSLSSGIFYFQLVHSTIFQKWGDFAHGRLMSSVSRDVTNGN